MEVNTRWTHRCTAPNCGSCCWTCLVAWLFLPKSWEGPMLWKSGWPSTVETFPSGTLLVKKGKHWSKRKRVGQKGQHWSKTIVHQKEALVVYIAAATCALSNVHCQRTQRPWPVQTQQNHFPKTRQQAGPGLVPAVVVDAADAFAHHPVATVVVFRVAGLEQSAQQPTEWDWTRSEHSE